ncbi:phage late control D family protein [Pseudovibrio ascidiaceicola]|uniref:phage late control D family protein n=1 Tax=Pseudovibrio ascidiaceicola TaxID=285279 RepID=UPI003D366419
MTPFFEVWSNGQDISGRMRRHGTECVITENAGGNSDTVTFSVTDPLAEIDLPPKGTEFNLVAGLIDPMTGKRYERDFGRFKVDQSLPSGFPHTIGISAQSLDVGSKIKEKRTKAFKAQDYPTIGKILEEIAGANDLEPKISKEVAKEVNRYQAQSEEDDIEFATRLAAKFDATVSVKDGKLIVIKKGTGKKVSGKEIPIYIIEHGLNLLDNGGYSGEDVQRPAHSKVVAKWFDRQKAQEQKEEARTEEEGPDFVIPEVLPSKEEAASAAKTKASEINRSIGKVTFKTRGDPFVQVGCFVLARNIRKEIDGIWSTTTISHHFSGNSYYYNSFQCEVPTQGRKKSVEQGDQKNKEIEASRLDTTVANKMSPYAPNPDNIGLNEGDGPE